MQEGDKEAKEREKKCDAQWLYYSNKGFGEEPKQDHTTDSKK